MEADRHRLEFVLEKDRTASIAFYDASLRSVPPGDRQVTLIAETIGGKKIIEFERKGDALMSRSKLPDGAGYRLVLQFRPAADMRPTIFRFVLDTSHCGGCQRAEYACICGH
jgi:hypothetical protein